MMSLSQSIAISAPPEAVFAYVTEPATLAEWLPPMVETREIVGSGEGQQFEWSYKLGGILFRGQSIVVDYVPNALSEVQSIGAISSTWKFLVEPEQGHSKLTIEIKYEVPVPVLGKLAERVIVKRDARNLEVALSNVKDTLEA